MNNVEIELNRWRDSYVGSFQGPGMFEKARSHARVKLSQGQEPSAMQICYAYVMLLDESLCNFYNENRGKTYSVYCQFDQNEINALVEVCKKANGLALTIGSAAAGAYLGSSFGLIGAAVGGFLGAVAGSKYNDSDREKIYGVVREAFYLYFDIMIRRNNQRLAELENKFISLMNEFMEKYKISETEMVKFGEEAMKSGVNIAYFSTLEQIEKQYFKMYPRKIQPKSNESSNNGSHNESHDAMKQLDELIGLESVKTQVKRLRAVLLKDKGDIKNINLNMCFYGNPGTGKTVVARIIANILYEEGILKTNNLIETDRSGLVGEYLGQTAPKTHEIFEKAKDGVLFIDEAYTLHSKGIGDQYGKEAIAALLADMENYRGQICVILAGYKKEMEEMIAVNPGFDSRINRKIEFPDYSSDELIEIMKIDLKKYGRTISNDALNSCKSILDYYSKMPNFANGRTARNLVEELRDIQAERTVDNSGDYEINLEDVDIYKKEHSIIY